MSTTAESTLADYLSGLDNLYDQKKIAAVQRLLPNRLDGLKGLDLGCGGGCLTVWMAQNGAESWGVDLSAKRTEGARLLAEREGVADRCHFVHGDVCAVDLGVQFDVVLAKDIIEHVDESAFLHTIRRHLKPGGRVVVVTHNSISLQYALVAPVYWLVKRERYLGSDPTHLRMYTARSLNRVLRRGGLTPMQWRGTYHLPYRLLKSVVPLSLLERLQLHLIEDIFGAVWPFSATGWTLCVACQSVPTA